MNRIVHLIEFALLSALIVLTRSMSVALAHGQTEAADHALVFGGETDCLI